ncbi:MAG: hypothetical protein HDS53_02365 [Barnesiella sp.]|nr:hypothetical protein [Barnesiella sp.]
MKKLIYLVAMIIGLSATVASCGDSGNSWTEYEEWRNANIEWYLAQKDRKNPDGTPYYKELNPSWYTNSGVLIHYFNDRKQTEGNLSPLITSQVSVKYKGELYNGSVFDSTAVATSDSVRTFTLSGTVIGWKVALTDMHVGDTCEVVLPYTMGYGAAGNTSISPYSSLKFGIKLVDIPAYEIP